LADLPSVYCFQVLYAEIDGDLNGWQIAFQCVLILEGSGCVPPSLICAWADPGRTIPVTNRNKPISGSRAFLFIYFIIGYKSVFV
jgi:hypothetical protein